MDNFIEKLREEYSGLGLTDEQILIAKSNNITPDQIAELREACNKLSKTIHEIWEKVAAAFNVLFNSEEFQNAVKVIQSTEREKINTFKRNTKGKQLKAWEKNRFFN